MGCSPVQILRALAQIEIDQVDRVHLFDLIIAHSLLHIRHHQTGGRIQHTLEIFDLVVELNFDDDLLTEARLAQQIDPIDLVVFGFGDRFGFEQGVDPDVAPKQRAEEPLKNRVGGLVLEQALDGPVETDERALWLGHEGIHTSSATFAT